MIKNQLIPLGFVFAMCLAGCGKTSPASSPTDDQFLVDIDGNRYQTIAVGDQRWMAENLRSSHAADASTLTAHEPNNDPSLVGTYGRLYDWKEAQRACPKGWHLPTDAEWTTLESELATTPNILLKDDTYWKSNSKSPKQVGSFLARPAGYWNDQGFDNYFGSRAVFWTSTAKDSHFVWSRVIGGQTEGLRRADQHPQYGFSVRCVQSVDSGKPKGQ